VSLRENIKEAGYIVASHSDCASAILVATLSNSFPISLMIATNFSL